VYVFISVPNNATDKVHIGTLSSEVGLSLFKPERGMGRKKSFALGLNQPFKWNI